MKKVLFIFSIVLLIPSMAFAAASAPSSASEAARAAADASSALQKAAQGHAEARSYHSTITLSPAAAASPDTVGVCIASAREAAAQRHLNQALYKAYAARAAAYSAVADSFPALKDALEALSTKVRGLTRERTFVPGVTGAATDVITEIDAMSGVSGNQQKALRALKKVVGEFDSVYGKDVDPSSDVSSKSDTYGIAHDWNELADALDAMAQEG